METAVREQYRIRLTRLDRITLGRKVNNSIAVYGRFSKDIKNFVITTCDRIDVLILTAVKRMHTVTIRGKSNNALPHIEDLSNYSNNYVITTFV